MAQRAGHKLLCQGRDRGTVVTTSRAWNPYLYWPIGNETQGGSNYLQPDRTGNRVDASYMKKCADCGTKIGIRATRCADCRRVYRTRYERERARGTGASERPVDDVDEHGLPRVHVAPD